MKSNKKLRRYLKCFVDLKSIHPWPGKFTGPCATLHRIAREEKSRHVISKHEGGPPRLICQKFIQRILWILFSLWQSVFLFLRPKRVLNGNRFLDFLDIPRTFVFALKFNIAPDNFYLYELHKSHQSDEEFYRYLMAWECAMICRRISRMRGSDVGAIDNKDRFVDFCDQHKLPTIPVIPEDLSCNDPLLPRDLFAKTVFGHSGEGCLLLRHDASNKGWVHENQVLNEDNITEFLKAHFKEERYILQYRVKNHPAMYWLSEKVLTTLRIVTAWDPSGNPVTLRATLRLPTSHGSFLDNSSQGGMSVPVDPLTGKLSGPATRWNQDFTSIHPLGTDKSFLGFQLPLWDETMALVLKSHSTASNYNFLGWDVAISGEGPLLVECNVWSDIDLVQVPQKMGFLTDEVIACFMAETTLEKDFLKESIGSGQ